MCVATNALPKHTTQQTKHQPKFFLLKCLVTCPPSLYPGDAFDIAVGDGTYTVTVPKGINPGQQFTVRVDTREVAETQRSSATAAAAAADAASSRERPVPLGDAVRTGIRGGKANTGIRGLWSVDATEPDEDLEDIEDDDERVDREFQLAEVSHIFTRRCMRPCIRARSYSRSVGHAVGWTVG